MSGAALRITHLVENLERGGLERVVVDLALEQAARGHDVQVVCVFEEGRLAPELAARRVPVIACRKGRGADAGVLGGIRRALRAHGSQVLHTHNPVPHYYGSLAALGLPLARVSTRHGMGNAPFTLRREILFRLALAGTPAVALVCRKARDNFVRHRIVPAGKAVVVPNGIPVASFSPQTEASRAAALALLGGDPSHFHVGIVGRLNPVKDHATLLRAMARVSASVKQARLVVIGGGRLQASLEAQAGALGLGEVVRFLGDRSDVAALLPGLDAFVLSSLTEGYSISLLEASAAALPIVATDVGGNAEIVKAGVTGLLAAAGDDAAIAGALMALAADPGRRRAMGHAARQWVEAEGTVGTMATRYEALYRQAGAPGSRA